MATYLIDYENVYIEGLTGLEYLTKRDEVVIFYTQNRCGLTFELHQRSSTSTATPATPRRPTLTTTAHALLCRLLPSNPSSTK